MVNGNKKIGSKALKESLIYHIKAEKEKRKKKKAVMMIRTERDRGCDIKYNNITDCSF